MKFSIIIPFRELDDYTRESVKNCLQLNGDFEIILLPDNKIKEKFPKKVKIIPTGAVKPGIKRNMASREAKYEYLAFIDSDAYPDKNWLKNSEKYFDKPKVGAVGGPNLTPKRDNWKQKISGDILANPLTGRSFLRYVVGKKVSKVKELPSCNLIVRKDIFLRTGGYDPSFLTAEDTKLCFSINSLGYLILYVPDVVVYHHRREILWPHIRQIYIYGRDVAWLFKQRGFSWDVLYYSMLSWGIISTAIGFTLSFFNPILRILFIIGVILYVLPVIISSIVVSKGKWLFSSIGLMLTHASYGIGFIIGLVTNYKKGGLNLR